MTRSPGALQPWGASAPPGVVVLVVVVLEVVVLVVVVLPGPSLASGSVSGGQGWNRRPVFHGSGAGSVRAPVVGMVRSQGGNGYSLIGADGSVLRFGDA